MGNDVSTDTSSNTESAPETAPLAPTLTIVHHPEQRWVGERCVVSATGVDLGRGAGCFGAGALDHGRLSRRHARFVPADGGLLVEDLGSHNGTAIDGARVTRAVAQPGSVIELGPVLLLFHLAPAVYAAPRSPCIVGKSAAIAAVLRAADAVARHATTVLVVGETGTGKELVAREIHDRSGRKGKLVAVNCGAIPAGVLHSELFGHERGAFSGAVSPRRGLFEEAAGGTIFLDEIGDAPPDMQVALLRVLQEREVRPVGSSRSVPVDARVLAATHQDLDAFVARGRFREDLLARLTHWEIRVPPLAQRREDIPLLVAAILGRLGEPRPLHRTATAALLRAAYPRNVRELQAAVERMVRAAAPEDLEIRLSDEASALLTPERAAPAEAPPARVSQDRASLQRLLLQHGGNVTRAARHAGIGRNTLYRWLRAAEVTLDDLREGE